MRFALIVTVAVVGAGSLPVCAAIPGADDPNAYSEHHYRRSLLAFQRRTSVEAYDRVGKRDPKWDEPARAFLEAMARRFAYWGAYDSYRVKPLVTLRELIELDKAVQETGCTDPLIGYFHAVVQADQDKPYLEVRPLFERASRELLASGYPITRAWGATYRWLDLFNPKNDESYAKAFAQLKELTVRILATSEYQGVDRRILLDAIDNWIDAEPFERRKEFVEAIAANGNVDPWMAHVIRGRFAIEQAWKHRGSGYANTVSEQGWKQFSASLAEATTHLTAAHALHPNHPEPAADMIRVSMGVGRNVPRELRKWLDASLRAQIDYTPAFEHYLYALMPRWHGSHAEMYAFGVECLDTGRFDVRLPWQINNAIERIANDENVAFWSRPGVYANVKRMCDGYGAKFGVSSEGDWYRSYLAAVQWRTARYAESVAQMNAVEDRFQPDVFDGFKVLRGVAVSEAHAMSSNVAGMLKTAEQHAAAGETDDAISGYRDAFNALPVEHAGRPFVVGRLQALQWQRQFEKGSWVNVHPDKDLTGWYPQTGTWQVDDAGTLIGTADEQGNLMLLCQNQGFGDSFVVEGTVDLGEDSIAAGLGIAPMEPAKYHGIYFWWDRKTGEQRLIQDFSRKVTGSIELKRVNAFQIVMADGVAGGYLNGKPAFGNQHIERNFRPTTYLGIGGKWAAKPGAKLRFTNLRIKRHDGPPEPTALDYVKPTTLAKVREATGGFPAMDARTFAAFGGMGAIALAIVAAILRRKRAKTMPASLDG